MIHCDGMPFCSSVHARFVFHFISHGMPAGKVFVSVYAILYDFKKVV